MTWQALLEQLESGPDSATYHLTLDDGQHLSATYHVRTNTWTHPESRLRCGGHGLILFHAPRDGADHRITRAKLVPPCTGDAHHQRSPRG